MKRQIAALALAGILAVGIVGCGQKPATTGAEQAHEAVEEVRQTDESPEEEAAQTPQQNQENSETSQGASVGEQTDGYVPSWSADDCTANALASVGAGGSAENVTTSELIEGGGTFYYLVEFDLGDSHYRVQVDATDGVIIDVIEIRDGKIQQYNEDGTVTQVDM